MEQVDGVERLVWRFDPLLRAGGAGPFVLERFVHHLERVLAPTLVVAAENGTRLADRTVRTHAIPDHEFVVVDGAGHMVHWTQPEELASLVCKFIEEHRDDERPPGT